MITFMFLLIIVPTCISALLGRITWLVYIFSFSTAFVAASAIEIPSLNFSLQPSFLLAIIIIFATILKFKIIAPRIHKSFLLLQSILIIYLFLLLFSPLLQKMLGMSVKLINPLLPLHAQSDEYHTVHITQLVYFLLFIITSSVVGINIRSTTVVRRILQILLIVGVVSCIWGIFVQFIYSGFLGNDYPYYFFNNSTAFSQGYSQKLWIGPVYIQRICSFAPEPSMYGFYLSILSTLCLILNMKKCYVINPKLQTATLSIFTVTNILSMSSTGLLGVAITYFIGLIYGIYSMIKSARFKSSGMIELFTSIGIFIIPGIITVVGATAFLNLDFDTFLLFYKRISLEKVSSGLGQERFDTIIMGINNIFKTGLLGTGCGSNRTFEFGTTLLLNLGIYGAAFFFFPIFFSIININKLSKKFVHKNKNLFSMASAATAALICAFFLMFVSIPDLTYTYVWLLYSIIIAIPIIVHKEFNQYF